MTLSRKDSPGIPGFVEFSVGLGDDAQMPKEAAAVSLVLVYVLVDGLVADGEGSMLAQPIGDLLRTPVLLQ